MGVNELFLGPGTSERMQQIAQSLPPYDLLKAYREAQSAFGTDDIVLVVVPDEVDGIVAQPRPVYLETALRHWTPQQRATIPLPIVQKSAHRHLLLPADRPAFWLAVESPQDGATGYAAIGCVLRPSEPTADALTSDLS